MQPISRVTWGVTGALLLATAALWSIGVGAQATQPIYLQYDGFVRNADGGLTVSFGYFNMNNTDVTIEAGAANSFAPAPGDRNQPVVFLKGRHRFACSMVVDKTFDGALQWTVAFAGKTSTTTAKALNPLYELELNSQKKSLQGLDIASAPRNVCLNRAPIAEITTSPFEAPGREKAELRAKVGTALPINARIEDDGLPRGSRMTSGWKKVSGPGDVTFSNAATAATRVTFGAAGDYAIELSGTDGEKTGRLTVTVHVS